MNRLDHLRVQPLARFLLQQPDRRFRGHRLVVRPLRHQRVEVVDDRQDARAERNLLTLQPGRIALAVPALVVAQDQRRHGIRERHRADDVGADLRMRADLLELFGRQRARLGQDVLGHRQLADVVQQRRRLHALDLVLAHPERRAPAPPRRAARGGCAAARSGPSRRSRAPALRSSPGAGRPSPACAAARLRPARGRPCSCDRWR